MRERDDLDVVFAFPIDEEERKTPQRKAAYAALRARHGRANLWMVRNQRGDILNLAPQPIAESCSLVFVPPDFRAYLSFRDVVGTNRLRHRPKISRSIRWRTSFQSDVTARP